MTFFVGDTVDFYKALGDFLLFFFMKKKKKELSLLQGAFFDTN